MNSIWPAIHFQTETMNTDPSALAEVATATLHTIAVRSRAGVSRKQLQALAAGAIEVICGSVA